MVFILTSPFCTSWKGTDDNVENQTSRMKLIACEDHNMHNSIKKRGKSCVTICGHIDFVQFTTKTLIDNYIPSFIGHMLQDIISTN